MKLINAKAKINQLAHIPFKDYISLEHYHNIIINKGKTGQILQLTIGLQLSNTTLDFEDGELKTNKCDRIGKPLETMFITQTASIIDELLYHKPFYDTKLFTKLQHLLYVPISKDGSPDEWMYLPCIEVDLSLPKYFELKKQLEADYYSICDQMNQQISLSNKEICTLLMVNLFKSEPKIHSHIHQYIRKNMTGIFQIKTVLFTSKKNL